MVSWRVALTFDDGPHPTITPRIVSALKEANAKATFFMLGSNVRRYPEIARLVKDEGHEIELHGLNHEPWLNLYTYAKIKHDLLLAKDILWRNLGVLPQYFRPPFGWKTPWLVAAARDIHFEIVTWTIDLTDAWPPFATGKRIERRAMNIKPGDIVLLHDTKIVTASVISRVIAFLKKNNFELVTLSELLK